MSRTRVPMAENGATLERVAAAAMMPKLFLKDVSGGRKRGRDVAIADLEAGGLVVGRAQMGERRAVLHGIAAIARDRQRIVIDLDARRGVLGQIARVGDNDGERFADIADFVERERELR